MTEINIRVTVLDEKTNKPIENARVELTQTSKVKGMVAFIPPANPFLTNASGVTVVIHPNAPDGQYQITATAFSIPISSQVIDLTVPPIPAGLTLLIPVIEHLQMMDEDFGAKIPYTDGDKVVGLEAKINTAATLKEINWTVAAGDLFFNIDNTTQPIAKILWDTQGAGGQTLVTTRFIGQVNEIMTVQERFMVRLKDNRLNVSLNRTDSNQTHDQPLWIGIRNRANAISFNEYTSFVDKVLCKEEPIPSDAANQDAVDSLVHYRDKVWTPLSGVAAYELLKTATQAFLLIESGLLIKEYQRYSGKPLYVQNDEEQRLNVKIPFSSAEQGLANYIGGQKLTYIQQILNNAFAGAAGVDCPFDEGFLNRGRSPIFLELIWSYWHEEAMLVQTMNAISVRFQNQRASDRDPLAHLEIAPLWPVNNLVWGYIQDEQNRLTVRRRAYEYDHHYGLNLVGKAVPNFRPADSRSRFIEAFHNLLGITTSFYRQSDDTTVIPDGFPLLNALKEVHLLLAQGAHNQFGDLPWTARGEMLMQQWMLARPEMREFLQSRAMVPYREPWMGQVDTMKRLQGWSDVSVTSFSDLGRFGEMILLSVRYGNWLDIDDSSSAANWANYWRAEIQGYIHAYRSVTGVDLTITQSGEQYQNRQRTTLPSVLLQQRQEQAVQTQQPAAQKNGNSNGRVHAAGGSNGNGAKAQQGAQPENLRQRRAARR